MERENEFYEFMDGSDRLDSYEYTPLSDARVVS